MSTDGPSADRSGVDGAVFDELADYFGDQFRRNEPIGHYTTYRVGGPAAGFVTVEATDELAWVARWCAAHPGVPILAVGKGSNLLVCDAGFDGLAVHLGSGFAAIDIDRDTCRVQVGASAYLPVVARQVTRAGLAGFEWAVGVPGSMGGAVRMNAGGHGSEMAMSLVEVELVDLRTGASGTVSATELDLRYRHSAVEAHQMVSSAVLQLVPGDPQQGEALLSSIVRWRRENQPGGANAGSVFANPPGDSAGRLIDASGLKGFRIGTAEVSTKHANFIQADPDGHADDVYAVICHVQRQIEQQHGVHLRVENRLIGFES